MLDESLSNKILLELFNGKTGGIDNWLSGDPAVLARIADLPRSPIGCTQMNQLLALSHQAAMSEDFFRYYWLSIPNHTFDIRAIPFFDETYDGASAILSLDQLVWGLHRIYMDCLLYFGTIRIGYRELRHKSWPQLIRLFDSHKFNTERLRHRGPYLPLNEIARDDRYLISEQACKTLDHPTTGRQELDDMLHGALISAQSKGASSSRVRDLINPDNLEDKLQSGEQRRMLFVTDEILDREVKSKEELIAAINELQNAFHGARSKALKNTELYLSMANDLDVYVATSMRSREDFSATVL